MSSPKQCVFLGHSFTRRLGIYINETRPNFGFSRERIEVHFVGVGGLKINQLVNNEERLNLIRNFHPQTLVLQIGDNDINPESIPHVIVEEMLSAASALRGLLPSVIKIVFVKIMPRNTEWGTSRYLFHGYNALAMEINGLLQDAIWEREIKNTILYRTDWCFPQENEEKFANLIGLGLGIPSSYDNDGVHLSPVGMRKLVYRLRQIVVWALKDKL